MNTLLLTVAAASVLLGTLYPLMLEVFGLGKISVGAPYFDTVFVPLMAPAVFLMGVAPLARWHDAALSELWTRLRWALALGAMLGVAVFIVGVTLVRSYQVETELRMAPGESVAVQGHVLTFEGVAQVQGPNYEAARGSVDLARDGRSLRKLHPEKRRYTSTPALSMTEAAVDSGVLGDFYVALGADVGQGAWTLRVYHKPFVTWIWGGCALMVMGGLLAMGDRRRAAQRAATANEAIATS